MLNYGNATTRAKIGSQPGESSTARHLGSDPPADLNDDEWMLFVELINACSPQHFVQSDLPLLVSYVQATQLARSMARDPEKIAVWEKAVRMQATLATRLRWHRKPAPTRRA